MGIGRTMPGLLPSVKLPSVAIALQGRRRGPAATRAKPGPRRAAPRRRAMAERRRVWTPKSVRRGGPCDQACGAAPWCAARPMTCRVTKHVLHTAKCCGEMGGVWPSANYNYYNYDNNNFQLIFNYDNNNNGLLGCLAKSAETQNWVPSVAGSNPALPPVAFARRRPCG